MSSLSNISPTSWEVTVLKQLDFKLDLVNRNCHLVNARDYFCLH